MQEKQWHLAVLWVPIISAPVPDLKVLFFKLHITLFIIINITRNIGDKQILCIEFFPSATRLSCKLGAPGQRRETLDPKTIQVSSLD